MEVYGIFQGDWHKHRIKGMYLLVKKKYMSIFPVIHQFTTFTSRAYIFQENIQYQGTNYFSLASNFN